jgi:MFS family permease
VRHPGYLRSEQWQIVLVRMVTQVTIRFLYMINIYLNRFLGDLIPVVPLLGLLLLDRGFTLSTISLFFLCLSVTIIVAEIPAGILADVKNPRLVIIVSRLFKLLSFTTVYFATNIYILCLAAILWGLSSALDSGAIQSYLFQLVRKHGKESQFEQIYSKTFTTSLIGLLLAGLIASQIATLGFAILQFIGIGALALCLVSALFFPRLTSIAPVETKSIEKLSFKSNFRSLLKLNSTLIVLLCIGVFAGGIKGSLDEYTALLLANKGLTFGVIGYTVFALEVLKTSGASVAARFAVSIKSQILILGILGTAFMTAALGNYIVVITALVVVIFIDAILWVHNDSAIQRHASEGNRATIASMKNFGTEMLAAFVFLTMWVFGESWDTKVLYMFCGSLLLVVSISLFLRGNSKHIT